MRCKGAVSRQEAVMIEIMFSEGAAGSMQLAKCVNNTVGGPTSVFFHKEDGSEQTPEELAAEAARVEEEYRNKQENAVPMEGTSNDVACFPLNLSMGDISAPFSDGRMEGPPNFDGPFHTFGCT